MQIIIPRKFLGFFLFLALAFVASKSLGQIIVTDSSSPAAGENIIYSQSRYSVDVNSTGPNHTWDFSGVISYNQDTYKFASPANISSAYSTPFNGDIGLDLKNPNVAGSYAFFKSSSSDFRQVGLGITVPIINLPTPLPYSSPDIVYRFPMKYGNTDSCIYGGKASILGTSARISGKRVDTVDGWGVIITPYKTYNCLRIKSVVTEFDTLAGTPQNNSAIQYKWISNSEHIPVFQANVIPNGSGGTSMHLFYSDSYKDIMDPSGPQVDFMANDTNIALKDTVSFFDRTKDTLDSWLWTVLPPKYKFVGGTGNTSPNPKVLFTDTGKYWISLKGGKSSSYNTRLKINYITVNENSGINPQNDISQILKIYPNPSTGQFKLHFDNNIAGQTYSIEIFNSAGVVVCFESVINDRSDPKIDLSSFPTGLYLIKYQSNEKVYSGMINLIR